MKSAFDPAGLKNSTERDMAVAAARCPFSAPGPDHVGGSSPAGMPQICRALAEEPLTASRLVLAKGVAAFLEQRMAQDGTGLRQPLAAAGRRLAECLRLARHNEQLLIHLQFMAGVSERLLLQVADVRNFPRPLMYPLFSLVENGDHRAIPASLKASIARQKPMLKNTRTLESYLSDLCMEEESYLAASIPLALSALPVERLLELFGLTYALWRAMALLTKKSSEGAYYGRKSRQLRAALAQLKREGSLAPDILRGVARGARAFTFCLDLLEEASRESTARVLRRAGEIMRAKSQFALIHHEKVCLGGQRLVELFTDATDSGSAILDALGESPWINPEAVDESRFFQRLLGVGGKMHGVFSPSEIEVLKNYFRLKHRVEEDCPSCSECADFLEFFHQYAQAARATPAVEEGLEEFYRSAYFTLINAESRPAGIGQANNVLRTIFAEFDKCRPALEQAAEMKAFPYASAEFERRIGEIYYFQSRQTKSMHLALEGDALVALHLAFAPFALVDGCWLQNISAVSRNSRAGELLFSIFADEIGNGVAEANHAGIYGRLMDDFGIGLLPADHRGFAADRRIPHQAFKAPAFLLALNLCYAEYFHEILGVNLAIEMSGLDGFYEAMIENIEKRGMRSDFWRVHVSADNFSTGHARQSVHLIQDHMKTIERYFGQAEASIVWDRIWRGFLTMIYLFRIEFAVLLSTRNAKILN